MQTKQFNLPLDVGYILGLSGPSQATTRTDNVANVTLKNMLCGAIAEATNITVAITELNTPSGSKYVVALKMDVTSLGKCQAESWVAGRTVQSTARIAVEIRDVNRRWITDAAAFSFLLGCDTRLWQFSDSRQVDAGGWLQDWASTTLRVDGAFTPCGG